MDHGAHRWRRLNELSIAAHGIGRYQRSAELTQRLLDEHLVPEAQRARIERNLRLARAML